MAKRPVRSTNIDTPQDCGSRTLIERAYNALKEDIFQGQWVPGQKLRVEHMKDRYAVGAGTLREALARLVSDALVIAEGQRGFTVAPMAVEELEDLTNLRVFIETSALQEAIRNADDEWRQQLRTVFERLSALETPLQTAHIRQWEVANAAFHEALLAGGASLWTLRVLRQLSAHAERYRRLAIRLPGSVRNVHSEHLLVFESAMGNHPARAALALEIHIRNTPDLLITALRSGTVALADLARLPS